MDIKPQIGVRLDVTTPDESLYLKKLAALIGLPLVDDSSPRFSHFLTLRDSVLEVHTETAGRKAVLSVNFLSGPVYYRFINDRTIKQPLAKAVGVKRGYRPIVMDATAGFGEDSFVLASLGCRVIMVERSPLIWALLADGIARCQKNEQVHRIFDQRVTLRLDDSISFLDATDQDFDVVYLDPMYPASTGSALNKQRMRLLRDLVGDDADVSELLTAALARALKRVTVKRPLRAEHLDERKPSFSITAKSSRYDIYLTPYL